MTGAITVAVASLECLFLSLVVVLLCLIPASIVGVSVPVRLQALMVGWGGVAVAVAAVAVNL